MHYVLLTMAICSDDSFLAVMKTQEISACNENFSLLLKNSVGESVRIDIVVKISLNPWWLSMLYVDRQNMAAVNVCPSFTALH